MIRRPPRSTPLYSSAASDVYKRERLVAASAAPSGFVHPDLGGKDGQRAAQEAHGAVRVVTGAAALDQLGPTRQIAPGRWGGPLVGELHEGVCDKRQAVQARPALPGRLQGQVSDDPGRLDDSATVDRQCGQYPGADGSTERAQVGIAERERPGLLRGEPVSY